MPEQHDKTNTLSVIQPGAEMDNLNEINHFTIFIPYNSGQKQNNQLD